MRKKALLLLIGVLSMSSLVGCISFVDNTNTEITQNVQNAPTRFTTIRNGKQIDTIKDNLNNFVFYQQFGYHKDKFIICPIYNEDGELIKSDEYFKIYNDKEMNVFNVVEDGRSIDILVDTKTNILYFGNSSNFNNMFISPMYDENSKPMSLNKYKQLKNSHNKDERFSVIEEGEQIDIVKDLWTNNIYFFNHAKGDKETTLNTHYGVTFIGEDIEGFNVITPFFNKNGSLMKEEEYKKLKERYLTQNNLKESERFNVVETNDSFDIVEDVLTNNLYYKSKFEKENFIISPMFDTDFKPLTKDRYKELKHNLINDFKNDKKKEDSI